FRPAATTPAMRRPWPTRARGSLSNATAPAPQPVADTRVQIAQLPIPTLPIPIGWKDSQNPQGTCANGSTYDDGELLVSQIVLKAEPTSAGASGAFVDMNGDGCRRAGSGFIAPTHAETDGPITLPGGAAGPLRLQSYDGTVGPVTGAVSDVFSGPNSPIRDIGFVAITPNQPGVVVPAITCSCTPVAGCPD